MALHNMMATLINRILLFVKINFYSKNVYDNGSMSKIESIPQLVQIKSKIVYKGQK